MTHSHSDFSDHYPCQKCELETMIDTVKNNGLGFTIENLDGQVQINTLIQTKINLEELIKLLVLKRDGKLQSNEADKN